MEITKTACTLTLTRSSLAGVRCISCLSLGPAGSGLTGNARPPPPPGVRGEGFFFVVHVFVVPCDIIVAADVTYWPVSVER